MKIISLCAALLCFASLAAADTFYVANFGVNTITQYDDNGNATNFTSAFVNGPNGLALDGLGNLYVSTNSNTIEKFSPSGTALGIFASTGLNNALGLAFDKSGNLYAANFGEKITTSGSATVFALTSFNPAFIAIKRTVIRATAPPPWSTFPSVCEC